MYETAIPDETTLRLNKMAPAKLVVGIPSYRNSRTVSVVVDTVAAGLNRYYAHLQPVIVHADGHSFDKTLSIASTVPLPSSVRRVATRYQGLSGKGSALRVIFEIATQLEADAVLIVEADVVSFRAKWIPKLVDPILQEKSDIVLPVYQHLYPLKPRNDLIVYPLLSALFKLPLRQSIAGEVALSGATAAFLAEQDVWETAVAQFGIDVWMGVQVAFRHKQLIEVELESKQHRVHTSQSQAQSKFLQQIGTLFRLGYLHEQAWRRPQSYAITQQSRIKPQRLPLEGKASPAKIWQNGQTLIKDQSKQQWKTIIHSSHSERLEQILNQPDNQMTFDNQLWARLVYDFMVVYNLGEGDPDKVVTSLYPLYLLRHAAMLAKANTHRHPHLAYKQLVQRQRQAFENQLAYFSPRWDSYVIPEQIELWRKFGLLSE